MDFSSNPIVVWFESASDFISEHRRAFIIGFAGIAVAAAAGTGYWYYKGYMREQSHKAFVHALTYYEGAVGEKASTSGQQIFATDEEKWTKTAHILNQAAQDYASSELAPLCKAMESDALVHLGKLDEAVALLAGVVDKIANVAVRDFYRVKLALMKMDTGRELDMQQGLGALKMIADDAQSAAHESALYYLGAAYWGQKDFEQARGYWQTLLVKYGASDALHPSSFAEEVKEKLALLSVESL